MKDGGSCAFDEKRRDIADKSLVLPFVPQLSQETMKTHEIFVLFSTNHSQRNTVLGVFQGTGHTRKPCCARFCADAVPVPQIQHNADEKGGFHTTSDDIY